jgi:inhibitor of cysteine peptidase
MNGPGTYRGFAAIVLILIIIGTAIASAGCGSQANAAGGSMKLTEADNGKTIEVKVGDVIKVIIAGNPTTGYSWAAALGDKDAAVIRQQGEPAYEPESKDGSVVGSGGTYTFAFKAVAPGQAVLKLDYARAWEEGVAPIQSYSVRVTVK